MDIFLRSSKSLKEWLIENDLGWRLLLGLILLFCLSIFIHFREVRVETLELNSTSSKYIVAQVDFEFLDEEAMVILKQEALRDLGEVYQIDEKSLKDANYDLEYSLVNNPIWREKLSGVTLEEMYKGLDSIKNFLKEVRFTDLKTKNKIKKYLGFKDSFFVISTFGKIEGSPLAKEYWALFREKLLKTPIDKNVTDFIISFLEKKEWFLTEDKKTEGYLREFIENTIPPKFTEVKAGTKIIGQGEKVRSRHLSMLNAMKKALNEKRNTWSFLSICGDLLMSLLLIILSVLYLKMNQKEILKSLQKLSLLVCILILTLCFSKITEYILLQRNILDAAQYPLLVPFAAILILILFNPNMAIFSVCFLSVLLTTTLAVDHSKFLLINFITSLFIVISTKSLRRRKEVFEICGKGILAAIPVIISFNFISKKIFTVYFLDDVGICLLFMLITAILVVGLLPILESLFDVMTDITLMEYMDPNNELLKRLTLEMPGTYQHSLVLGNLAEAAAQAIGANALLCKVATLYHDIGKLNNAHFFTENQQAKLNIHQLLTPVESAQVIISHVKDGVLIAKKYRLPQSFIDIIQQHHGTTLVYFFYRKELELQKGDPSKVDKSKFRYPGPRPRSKEAAIIMIADGVEAASRSLEEPTEESLAELIDQVVKDRAEDSQFDECNLTYQEIGIIKKNLAQTLIVTHHIRVKYPEKEKEKS